MTMVSHNRVLQKIRRIGYDTTAFILAVVFSDGEVRYQGLVPVSIHTRFFLSLFTERFYRAVIEGNIPVITFYQNRHTIGFHSHLPGREVEKAVSA